CREGQAAHDPGQVGATGAGPAGRDDRNVRNVKFHIRDATPADAGTLVAILIASKEASFPELVNDHDRNARFWTDRWKGYLTAGGPAQMSRGDGFTLLADGIARSWCIAACPY